MRPDAPRNPTTDRHAVIAEREVVVRTEIEPGALDLYDHVEDFWRRSTTPEVIADVGGARALVAGLRRVPRGAIVITHVTTFAGEAFVALMQACGSVGRPELLARINGGYGDTHDDEMSAALWALAHGNTTMDEFLHEYGYQGHRGADLYATVWREDPSLLQPLLDAMATMPERDSPEATGAARTQDRIEAERELLDALRAPNATPPNRPSMRCDDSRFYVSG